MTCFSVETLHQTFELIKTILGRISKSSPDLARAPKLEATLYELDKFSRQAAKNYRTRLSDDLLSELSDLLVPFDLDLAFEDEIQYIGTGKAAAVSSASTTESKSSKPEPAKALSVDSTKAKDAFRELMTKKSAKGSETAPHTKTAKPVKPARPAPGSSKQTSIDVDDFDDDFLSNISTSDLDIIEKRARFSSGLPSAPLPVPRPQKPFRPPQPIAKTNINLAPRQSSTRPVGGFTSSAMRQIRMEHKQELAERNKRTTIGGVSQRMPAPSALGSGLGAYQGERSKVQPMQSSGSSASESSSDEENKGIAGLVCRQKSPKKLATFFSQQRRTIKVLGAPMADIVRQREDRRASQHAIKQRLRPDLNPLYRYILAWSPDHVGPIAPHPPKHSAELSALTLVPTTFPSVERYEQVMLPLYLQELWPQCIQNKAASLPVPVEISSRTYEDDFLDLQLTVQGAVPYDFMVHDSDVVVLRQPGARAVFAKVQGFRRKFKDTTLKVRILVMCDQKELAGRSKWQLAKHLSSAIISILGHLLTVLSLSTALREFAALRGLPYYEQDMLADILSARSAVMPRLSDPAIDEAKRAYDANEPQARAILGAMAMKGFALIQGSV